MASCNLDYSGHTGVINASADVYEISTSGKTRTVRVVVWVWAADYSGNRDSAYSVYCAQSGTNKSVGMYQGFYINGNAQAIFDETFTVSISAGSDTAYIDLSFTAKLYSSGAGATRSIEGSISRLTLTREPSASASSVSCNSQAQMGSQLLISINRSQSTVTHNLYYSFGGVETLLASGVGSNYGWNIPDMADRCTNALSGMCRIRCVTYLNGSYIGESSCNVTLTVPGYTRVSISGNNAVMGTSKSIACPRQSAAFTVVLDLLWQGETTELARGQLNSHSWTPGYDLAKKIPNLTYGTGTLRCATYNGTALVGTDTTPVSVSVPENDITKPKFTVNDLVLSVVTNLTGALAGVYIRGLTGVKGTMNASSDYSTISRYALKIGSSTVSGNPATLNPIQSEGTVAVEATATDARGFSRTVTTSIQVLPYQQPSVVPCAGAGSVVCDRATADGAISANGTYLCIQAGKSFSSLVAGGAEQNGCVLQYRYKIASATSFGEWATLLGTESAETEIQALLGNIVTSTITSYVIELRALDKMGGHRELQFQIGTEHISFALYDGEDGAAFGKYPEDAHVVDIAEHMTLRVRGKMELVGQCMALQYSENVTGYSLAQIVGNSGLPNGCCVRVENGNHVYVGFNCTLQKNFRVNVYKELYKDGGNGSNNQLYTAITAEAIPKELRPKGRVWFDAAVAWSKIGRLFARCWIGDPIISSNQDGIIYLQYGYAPFNKEGDLINFMGLTGYVDYWI